MVGRRALTFGVLALFRIDVVAPNGPEVEGSDLGGTVLGRKFELERMRETSGFACPPCRLRELSLCRKRAVLITTTR